MRASHRPRIAVAGLTLGLVLAACSGDSGETLGPTESPEPTLTATPTATVSASATATATSSVKPSVTASTPGKAVGTPITAQGSSFQRTTSGGAITISSGSSCEELYPELLDVSCDEVRLHGGSVLWVAGTEAAGTGRQWVLRLHTFDEAAGGYHLAYTAQQADGGLGFTVRGAKLIGFGVDSLVAITRLQGNPEYRAYDVFTWRKGGPLVLRAHRGALRLGRIALPGGTIEEYAAAVRPGEQPCCPSRFVHNRLQWDGRQFLGASLGDVPAKDAPPG